MFKIQANCKLCREFYQYLSPCKEEAPRRGFRPCEKFTPALKKIAMAKREQDIQKIKISIRIWGQKFGHPTDYGVAPGEDGVFAFSGKLADLEAAYQQWKQTTTTRHAGYTYPRSSLFITARHPNPIVKMWVEGEEIPLHYIAGCSLIGYYWPSTTVLYAWSVALAAKPEVFDLTTVPAGTKVYTGHWEGAWYERLPAGWKITPKRYPTSFDPGYTVKVPEGVGYYTLQSYILEKSLGSLGRLQPSMHVVADEGVTVFWEYNLS